ncbi:MAG: YraN family protein [Bilophila sp.]
MQDRKDRGKAGEDAAEALLKRSGFRILHRNWRKGSRELDLVAMDGDTLVFVEVRTRRAGGLISPMESLHPAKCRHVVQAATSYLAENGQWDTPCRFDFVCVVDTGTTLELEHVRHVDLSEYATKTVGRCNATWQPW